MHLFLDLDGTLIDNYYDESNKMIIKERPYIQPFFNFIFENFETVSIWTNAEYSWFLKAYQEVLYRYIPNNKKFTYVYTNNRKDGITRIKDLHYFYKKYPNTFNEYNTFILDDTPYTYQNNPDNAIPIKPYCYESDNDKELLRVMYMLNKHLFK
jgi:TFIIF-interacting CTD phosphatase-like protein